MEIKSKHSAFAKEGLVLKDNVIKARYLNLFMCPFFSLGSTKFCTYALLLIVWKIFPLLLVYNLTPLYRIETNYMTD